MASVPQHARHDQALAVDHGQLARRTVGQAGHVVVHREVAGVPALDQAVAVPAGGAIERRLDDVHGPRLQGQLALGEHRILVGLLVEVHLDAGRLLEGREDRLGQLRITRPAHEIHLARGGKGSSGDDRGRRQRAMPTAAVVLRNLRRLVDLIVFTVSSPMLRFEMSCYARPPSVPFAGRNSSSRVQTAGLPDRRWFPTPLPGGSLSVWPCSECRQPPCLGSLLPVCHPF